MPRPLEIKPRQVLLFPVDKTSDGQPDWRGFACVVIDGQELRFEVSLWHKLSKANTRYMSGEIQEPWRPPNDRDATQDHAGDPIPRHSGPPSAEELAAMPAEDSGELPF